MTVKTEKTGVKSSEIMGIIAGLLTVMIWGGYLSSARAGVIAGLSGMDIAFIRICVAALLLAPFALNLLLGKGQVFRWRYIAVMTILIGPPFVFISAGGYVFAPLAQGAILTPAMFTIGGLIFAKYLLKDEVSLQAKIGVGIIIVGLLFVAGSAFFDISLTFLIGDLLFIIGGLMWALAASLQKKWNLQPIEIASFVSVLGAIFFVPYYLSTHSLGPIQNLSLEMFWFMVIVQGVLSGVVALFAFTKTVQLLGAARASLFPALVPAVGILTGIPVTGEMPDFYQWLGLFIVTIGLTVVVWRTSYS